MTKKFVFDVFGRLTVEVERIGSDWVPFEQTGDGKRIPIIALWVPDDAGETEMINAIDVHFHEISRPGSAVRRIEETY